MNVKLIENKFYNSFHCYRQQIRLFVPLLPLLNYTASSNNTDYDLIDTHYKSYSGQAVMAKAKQRLDGCYSLTSNTWLKSFLSAGLQQTLYGNKIKIDQQVPNAAAVTVQTKDKSTLASFDADMSLVSDNGFTSDLRVSGSTNSDRTDYTSWANIAYSF